MRSGVESERAREREREREREERERREREERAKTEKTGRDGQRRTEADRDRQRHTLADREAETGTERETGTQREKSHRIAEADLPMLAARAVPHCRCPQSVWCSRHPPAGGIRQSYEHRAAAAREQQRESSCVTCVYTNRHGRRWRCVRSLLRVSFSSRSPAGVAETGVALGTLRRERNTANSSPVRRRARLSLYPPLPQGCCVQP